MMYNDFKGWPPDGNVVNSIVAVLVLFYVSADAGRRCRDQHGRGGSVGCIDRAAVG